MAEQQQTGVHRERNGVVVSKSGQKSVVVEIRTRRRHERYGKVMWYTNKFHVHDEKDSAKVGDEVVITDCRPISRMKRWRLLEVKRPAGA